MGPAILTGVQSILHPALEATHWEGAQTHSEQLPSLLTARSSSYSRGMHPGPTCGMFCRCHGPCDFVREKKSGELSPGSKLNINPGRDSVLGESSGFGGKPGSGGGNDSGLRLVCPTISHPAGGQAAWPGPQRQGPGFLPLF